MTSLVACRPTLFTSLLRLGLLATLLGAGLGRLAAEQAAPAGTTVVTLGAPPAKAPELAEARFEFGRPGNFVLTNVSQATLEVFLPAPEKANGTAVLIIPGGGMKFISLTGEGHIPAKWFAERGFAAFVLKYRTALGPRTAGELGQAMNELVDESFFSPDPRKRSQQAANMITAMNVAGEDLDNAVREIRTNAARYGVRADRVVGLGFSAGGGILLGNALQPASDRRVDFAASLYSATYAVGISGEELPKVENGPKIFYAAAADDRLVGQWQVSFYNALVRAGYKVDLHLFANGGHGFGLAQRGGTSDHWIDSFVWWLEANGLTKP